MRAPPCGTVELGQPVGRLGAVDLEGTCGGSGHLSRRPHHSRSGSVRRGARRKRSTRCSSNRRPRRPPTSSPRRRVQRAEFVQPDPLPVVDAPRRTRGALGRAARVRAADGLAGRRAGQRRRATDRCSTPRSSRRSCPRVPKAARCWRCRPTSRGLREQRASTDATLVAAKAAQERAARAASEAAAHAKREADRRAEEAAARAREEAKAERRARELAEKRAQEEAERRAEAEKRARHEAERLAKEAADRGTRRSGCPRA